MIALGLFAVAIVAIVAMAVARPTVIEADHGGKVEYSPAMDFDVRATTPK